MRPNQFITKSIAFICLLVLSQKMGAGLYLHNLFHNKYFTQSSSAFPDTHKIFYACNCIDDFTMPFTETNSVELPGIAVAYFDHVSFFKEPVSFSFHFFNSLRAPPVAVA